MLETLSFRQCFDSVSWPPLTAHVASLRRLHVHTPLGLQCIHKCSAIVVMCNACILRCSLVFHAWNRKLGLQLQASRVSTNGNRWHSLSSYYYVVFLWFASFVLKDKQQRYEDKKSVLICCTLETRHGKTWAINRAPSQLKEGATVCNILLDLCRFECSPCRPVICTVRKRNQYFVPLLCL